MVPSLALRILSSGSPFQGVDLGISLVGLVALAQLGNSQSLSHRGGRHSISSQSENETSGPLFKSISKTK